MKVLVYDPFSGISGDMHMGAMVDLGVPEEYIIETLEALSIPGWSVHFRKEQRGGMAGTRAIVEVEGDAHDHNHEHEHGQSHAHSHEHRGLKEISEIVEKSSLPKGIKTRSMDMFKVVAEAEAIVHGMPIEEVHFHEVGAIDSIIDIVAAAAAIEYLKPNRIISFPPELGGGFVNCAHGRIPVPAPATTEILSGVPTRRGLVQKETTTPTGAAILKANVNEFVESASFVVTATGYGAGTRELRVPNLLRVFLAEVAGTGLQQVGKDPPGGAEETEALMLECNIDDMNPELYDHVLAKLYGAGVKEAFLTPIQMKKNRPAFILTVMILGKDRARIMELIFRETTTAGIREYPVRQTMLRRNIETLDTEYGQVRVKNLFYDDSCISRKPEYDDLKALAESRNVPLKEIYRSLAL
jgi:hypothetical protein